MTKSKKIALAVVIPICVIVLVMNIYLSSLGIALLKSSLEHVGWTAIDYYSARWDFEFPDNMKIEYSISAIGLPSDGTSYAIFTFDTKPSEFLKDFKEDTDNESLQKFEEYLQLLPRDAKNLNKKLDKSKLILPNVDCIWHTVKRGADTMLLAFDEDTNKLFFIEHLL